MPGALQEGSKMEGGGGDNCHAIFKVSSSGMTLSAQDFPSPPSPSPVFRGLCFSTSWTLPWAFWGQILELSFPSPPLQKARWLQAWEYLKSLPSAPEMPPLGDEVYMNINQNWVLGGMDHPFRGSQTIPASQIVYTQIRKSSMGPLPSSRH